jgi:hypothetical protein
MSDLLKSFYEHKEGEYNIEIHPEIIKDTLSYIEEYNYATQ